MRATICSLILALFLCACERSEQVVAEAVPDETSRSPATEVSASRDEPDGGAAAAQAGSSRLSSRQIQSQLGLKVLSEPWSGDLDGMIERRVIRVLTVYGIGRYFIDGAQERGFTYELLKMFEDELNKRAGMGHLRVHVVFVPVSRDELIQGLLEGRGDIAAAGLTITEERSKLVDFSAPSSRPLSEILVTGPSAPPVATLEGLAGKTVHVRASSSYRESLEALSRRFEGRGLAPIDIEPISEQLEDEDLLEMVSGGLLPWAVVDDYKAETWKEVFTQLTPRPDLEVRKGGQIGYAIRKGSPKLMAALNEFLESHREGTMLGNVVLKRYLSDFDWVANALQPEDFRRFEEVVGFFKRYGEEYGMDYLLIAAQGYQESQLDQSRRSHAGAIGIMQLLPATAADPNVGIADITEAEANVHAGVRYLNFLRTHYFDDPAIDRLNQTLLALAAYNAGPARTRGLREMAAAEGLDPNRWFSNVEIIAAREIGRETVQYVANIYKYYVTYRMAIERLAARSEERRKSGIDD